MGWQDEKERRHLSFFTGDESFSGKTRCDTNFNSLVKVRTESAIAEAIIKNPTQSSLDAIQKISSRLYQVLSAVECTSPKKQTVLGRLAASAVSNRRIEKSFLPEAKNTGILSEIDAAKVPEALILDVLSKPVTQNNFILHLKISQTVAGMLFDMLRMKNRKDEDTVLLETLVKALVLDAQDQSIEVLLERYRELVDKIYPKPDEMKDIRFERKHNGTELTDIKSIYARDYTKTNVPDKSMFGAHVRGCDVWRVRLTTDMSDFAKNALAKDLPLIAGASGTTARWICLLELMGFSFKSSGDEKKTQANYVTNILGYMVTLGHHSMHEVAYVFQKAGANYKIGDYCSVISDDAFPHEQIKQITQHFDDSAHATFTRAHSI
jgi:hypothetical protein